MDEAYPDSVLVSDTVHDALEEESGYAFKSVRARNLKGFGRTRYWVLRREGAEDDRPRLKLSKMLPVELSDLPFLGDKDTTE